MGDAVAPTARLAGTLGFSGFPPARSPSHSQAHDRDQGEDLSPTPASRAADEGKAADPKGQQPASVDWDRIVPLGQVHPINGSGGNGKSGSGDAGTGRNGSGRKSAAQITGNPGT